MFKKPARVGLFFILVSFSLLLPLKESAAAYATILSSPQETVLTPLAKQVTPRPQIVQNIPLQTAAPVRVIIPSIALNSKVKALGTDSLGNMAVPSGTTKDVGWYKDGTIPGNVGSAVLDAHVFAAFSNLKKVQAGDDIYVMNSKNQKLHFVVAKTKTYALGDLTSATLFGKTDSRRLNLITCAGKLTPDHSTYDHRLVVFATLVDDQA